jgi:SAM-dependent methyltransferase
MASESSESVTAGYYDEAWKTKLARPEYATLEARWRSRWDFAFANIEDGDTVLDVGCGDGVLGGTLIQKKHCKVSGIDVSSYARRLADQRGLATLTCDVSNDRFPFEDRGFGCVILSCVLEHISHPEHALEEATRILRQGGRMIVTVPNPFTLRIRMAYLGGRFHPDLLHSRPGEGLHYRFWSYDQGVDKMVSGLHLPLKLSKREVDVKNPRLYSGVGLRVRRGLISLWPSLFGEYFHYLFIKS